LEADDGWLAGRGFESGGAIGSLVGALMKKTKGRANPQLANELLKKRILGQ
jgi:Asp-tRNA(Asn)/Glu-tRNA(Gln) amidotransferase B subunit